jgi:hypothetical protein
MAAQKTPAPETKTVTIQGLDFDLAVPYAEGHACTEAEAKALNQTRHENIRNNMARIVKGYLAATDDRPARTVEELTDDELTEINVKVAEYDTDYEFTLASVASTRRRDPVEIEAEKIARAAITAKLRADGRKVGDVDKDALAAAIEKVAAGENVRAQAAANIKARSEVAASDMEGLDL